MQSHMGKVIEMCIAIGLWEFIKLVTVAINETQFGGIEDKGTDDALLISNLITSSALERDIPLHKIYIDLVKAYDRISRLVLYKILEHGGVHQNYYN